MMTTMTETPTPRRDVPVWVFVMVILLCLGGGAAFVYWYFAGPGPAGGGQITLKNPEQLAAERETQLRERRGGQGQGQNRNRNFEPPAPPSLLEITNSAPDQRTYRVRGQVLNMEVVDHKTNPDTLSFRSSGRRLLNDEQVELARLRWRILRDVSVSKYLNIQDWQKQKLQELDSNAVSVPGDDRAKLAAAWAELDVWNKATNRESEQKLVALLNEVGGRAEAAMRTRMAEQVERVKTVLSPEQLDAFKKMGTPDAKTPPAPPAPAQ